MPNGSDEGELPEGVENRLRLGDVDLSDPKISHAVRMTYVITRDEIASLVRPILEGMERDTEEARRVAEETLADIELRKHRISNILVIFVGITSALFALASGFSDFSRALKELVKHLHLGEFVGGVAYAQSIGGGIKSVGVPGLGPIFIYVVYALFSVGYVVSLGGLFFGKQPKDRAHAMEILRNLTSFFIGAISGKFV